MQGSTFIIGKIKQKILPYKYNSFLDSTVNRTVKNVPYSDTDFEQKRPEIASTESSQHNEHGILTLDKKVARSCYCESKIKQNRS